MESLLQQILNLLIIPPGNLVYHLILAFSVLSTLQAAWVWRQANPSSTANRLLFGLGMLLLGQLILFLSSGLAWQSALDEHYLLPPLDRAVILFSLVWIIWLWNFPKPARLGDLVTGFLNLGVVLLLIFSYTTWITQNRNYAFNYSWIDWAWELANFFVVLTGMALLLFSRPNGWGFGLGMLGAIMTGLVAHLAISASGGDFSGYIRLGQIAAYPLLPTLLHRLIDPKPSTAEATSSDGAPTGAALPGGVYRGQRLERRRYSADPRTLHAWFEAATSPQQEESIARVAKAAAHSLLSDLVYVVREPSNEQVFLANGYDLIREEAVDGAILDDEMAPRLFEAIRKRQGLRIAGEDLQPTERSFLNVALDLNRTGGLMFLPIQIESLDIAGLLFLSPYSDRQWSQEDQNYLSQDMDLIQQIIYPTKRKPNAKSGNGAGKEDALQRRLDQMLLENKQLQTEINQLRSTSQATVPLGPASTHEDVTALIALQKELSDQITTLQAENERLQTALRDQGITVLSPQEFEQMETELRSTLQEVARLQNQLANANARNLSLEQEAQVLWSVDPVEAVQLAIARELASLNAKGIQIHTDFPKTRWLLLFDPITFQQMIVYLLQSIIPLQEDHQEWSFAVRLQENPDQTLLGLRLADQRTEPFYNDLASLALSDEVVDLVDPEDALVASNLPLTIVKMMIESHQGQFWMQQTEEQGFSLTVLLPVNRYQNHQAES